MVMVRSIVQVQHILPRACLHKSLENFYPGMCDPGIKNKVFMSGFKLKLILSIDRHSGNQRLLNEPTREYKTAF